MNGAKALTSRTRAPCLPACGMCMCFTVLHYHQRINTQGAEE